VEEKEMDLISPTGAFVLIVALAAAAVLPPVLKLYLKIDLVPEGARGFWRRYQLISIGLFVLTVVFASSGQAVSFVLSPSYPPTDRAYEDYVSNPCGEQRQPGYAPGYSVIEFVPVLVGPANPASIPPISGYHVFQVQGSAGKSYVTIPDPQINSAKALVGISVWMRGTIIRYGDGIKECIIEVDKFKRRTG
jgi:hypothetical protein